MRALVAMLMLLASVSASAGEIDGTAVLCKRLGVERLVMYEFRDDVPVRWQVDVDSDKAVVRERDSVFEADEYEISPALVTWTDPIGTKQLNRVTLQLSMTTGEEGASERVFQCELFSSLEDFQRQLEALRMREQAEIDQQMEHNKI